jgi:hypothetical protein
MGSAAITTAMSATSTPTVQSKTFIASRPDVLDPSGFA